MLEKEIVISLMFVGKRSNETEGSKRCNKNINNNNNGTHNNNNDKEIIITIMMIIIIIIIIIITIAI